MMVSGKPNDFSIGCARNSTSLRPRATQRASTSSAFSGVRMPRL
jgi:hypothetical protein